MALGDGLRYFDRAGLEISREQWMVEVADDPRAIALDTIPGCTVTTVWHGCDDAPPGAEAMNYYVAVDDGFQYPRIFGYYATKSAALDGHRDALVCVAGPKSLLEERVRANVIPLRVRNRRAKDAGHPERARMTKRELRAFTRTVFEGLVRVMASNWSTIVSSECASSSRPITTSPT